MCLGRYDLGVAWSCPNAKPKMEGLVLAAAAIAVFQVDRLGLSHKEQTPKCTGLYWFIIILPTESDILDHFGG